jgi:zinc transporter 1
MGGRITVGQWQRAETLGALINGVFLVALCLSIFLEAIQRFVEPQSVSNPVLVFAIGSFGLLSNLLGLFLFHEHSHSHGGEHGALATAEEGHAHGTSSPAHEHQELDAHQGGRHILIKPRNEDSMKRKRDTSHVFKTSDEDGSTVAYSNSPVPTKKRRHPSVSKARCATPDDINIYPASFRNGIIVKSRLEDSDSTTDSESEFEEAGAEDQGPTEDTSLLGRRRSYGTHNRARSQSHASKHGSHEHRDSWHKTHKHAQPKKSAKVCGNLNIRGVFLHVLGDALGNVGVMVSAVIIKCCRSRLALYADPAISLVITFIILGSAIPLCKAASRILLQAVPAGMDVDDIKEDVRELPGILGCHHLHVWQLSDTKLVASLHIKIEYDFKGEGSARYMELARAVQRCLHGYGIHSSTIQPEFCLDREKRSAVRGASEPDDDESHRAGSSAGGVKPTSAGGSKPGSMRGEPDACFLQCGVECDERGQCCAPGLADHEGRDEVS